jgi:hypothetical protein
VYLMSYLLQGGGQVILLTPLSEEALGFSLLLILWLGIEFLFILKAGVYPAFMDTCPTLWLI